MRVTRLDLRHLRRFSEVSLAPGPGLNLITGENGAGKTSVLEGLHLANKLNRETTGSRVVYG